MAKAIRKVIPAILKPMLDKRGLTQAAIILDWDKIMGGKISQYTLPEKITYYKNARSKGTLVLSVTPGWAPIIEHSKQQIMDRINAHFGYEAVSRLQMNQTLYRKPIVEIPSEIKETQPQIQVCTKELMSIENEALREALVNLKTSIIEATQK